MCYIQLGDYTLQKMSLLDFARTQAEDKDVWDYIALVVDEPEWLAQDEHADEDRDPLLRRYSKVVQNNEYLKDLYESFKQPRLQNQDLYDDDPYDEQQSSSTTDSELPELEADEGENDEVLDLEDVNFEQEHVQGKHKHRSLGTQCKLCHKADTKRRRATVGAKAKQPSAVELALRSLRHRLEKLRMQQLYDPESEPMKKVLKLVRVFEKH